MTALTGSSDSNTAPRRTKTAYRDAQDQGQYGRATGRGNSRGGGAMLARAGQAGPALFRGGASAPRGGAAGWGRPARTL